MSAAIVSLSRSECADQRGTVRIAVRDPEEAQADGAADIDCVLGHHVRLDHSALETVSFRRPSDVDVDLLYLAGAVAFADRVIRRGSGARWGRTIALRMPVYDLARWQSTAVANSLRKVLDYLTGDRWLFEFVPRIGDRSGQGLLALRRPPEGRLAVLPYSGGLDSFAALRLTSAETDLVPVAVTAESSGRLRQVATATTDHVLGPYHRARLPLRFSVGDHPERTCRTRTFVFLAAAALVARLAEASDVLVPENGQGSVGLSVLPSGAETPYRGTHPGFTLRLRHFLLALWGAAPEFRHPYVWETKADVLRRLQAHGCLEGWQATRSCSRGMHREKGPGVRAQCGVCCNCLLRRVALRSAGLADLEPFVWRDLAAPGLSHALAPVHAGLATTLRDRNIALDAVRDHQALADIAMDPARGPAFAQTVYETARALRVPSADADGHLRRLLHRHREDWIAFLATLPRESWVVRDAGGG